MKQVDLSSSQNSSNPFGKLQSQLQQALKNADAKAQDTLAQMFTNGLDNHYVLVRNLVIPGENKKAPGFAIPCVLVGPACMLAINLSAAEGFFRAKEDTWLEMEKNSQNYRPAARNLIQETQLMADRLDVLMQDGGLSYPEIQPVLFFANTGSHIESIRPTVRILQMDTVDRYLKGLRQDEALLDSRQVQALVDYISGVKKASEEAEPEPEAKPEKPANQAPQKAVKQAETLVRKMKLNRSQWIILGVMIGAQALILICLVFVILFTT